MTPSEVINGLKCCNSSKDLCFKCPYIKFGDNCSIKLRKDALKLIKTQQAEAIKQSQQIVKGFFCECIENDIMKVDVVDANAEICKRLEMGWTRGKKIDG